MNLSSLSFKIFRKIVQMHNRPSQMIPLISLIMFQSAILPSVPLATAAVATKIGEKIEYGADGTRLGEFIGNGRNKLKNMLMLEKNNQLRLFRDIFLHLEAS